MLVASVLSALGCGVGRNIEVFSRENCADPGFVLQRTFNQEEVRQIVEEVHCCLSICDFCPVPLLLLLVGAG